jgi:hypothetical protein
VTIAWKSKRKNTPRDGLEIEQTAGRKSTSTTVSGTET